MISKENLEKKFAELLTKMIENYNFYREDLYDINNELYEFGIGLYRVSEIDEMEEKISNLDWQNSYCKY